MTADEFIAWAMEQPETEHHELVAGEVVAMAPERAAHSRAKLRITILLSDAIKRAGLPCEAFVDGLAVVVDATTLYEPDALVRCGPPLADETVAIDDPLIVVDVLSRSSRSLDTHRKLADYFRIASLRHYLIVAHDIKTIIHHNRDDAGAIVTRIIRDGSVELDPPGIALRGLFG
jgi:Uma2 family endonuclease